MSNWTRWYDYSRARDMMLEATDTPHAPWYILRSDHKKRARLNCIAHFLSLIPYEKVPREKVELPKRSGKGKYDDQASLAGRTFVPETYSREPITNLIKEQFHGKTSVLRINNDSHDTRLRRRYRMQRGQEAG